mgnify:CR=1 FL=1
MNKDLIQARQKAMRNTSLVGALVNATLTFGKIIFGFIGHSHALLADGLHSHGPPSGSGVPGLGFGPVSLDHENLFQEVLLCPNPLTSHPPLASSGS